MATIDASRCNVPRSWGRSPRSETLGPTTFYLTRAPPLSRVGRRGVGAKRAEKKKVRSPRPHGWGATFHAFPILGEPVVTAVGAIWPL